MNSEQKQLLDDMNDFINRCKRNQSMWTGRWGFGPSEREDANELMQRYRELEPSC